CALRFCCFFFFQAEDGIRDGHVTGVQTCALPISKGRPPSTSAAVSSVSQRVAASSGGGGSVAGSGAPGGGISDVVVTATPTPNRSEERRVGKECRSRRALAH